MASPVWLQLQTDCDAKVQPVKEWLDDIRSALDTGGSGTWFTEGGGSQASVKRYLCGCLRFISGIGMC